MVRNTIFNNPFCFIDILICTKSIQRDFREETSLKSRFALRILYILLRSLRLGQASSSATTLEECTKAAQTFQAIVTKEVLQHDDKAGLLTHSSKADRTFPGKLHDLVVWLWQGIGDRSTYFRRASMVSFASLCPLLSTEDEGPTLSDESTIRKFIVSCHSLKPCASADGEMGGVDDMEGTSKSTTSRRLSVLSVVEGREENGDEKDNTSVVSEVDGSEFASSDDELRWLTALNASLDGYYWLLRSNFLSLEQTTFFPALMTVSRKRKADDKGDIPTELSSSVTMLTKIAQFLKYCAYRVTAYRQLSRNAQAQAMDVEGGDAQDDKKPPGKAAIDLGNKELAQIQALRAEVLRRVIQFMHVCLADRDPPTTTVVTERFREQKLWGVPLFDTVTPGNAPFTPLVMLFT